MDATDAIEPAIVGAIVAEQPYPHLVRGKDVAAAVYHGLVWDLYRMVGLGRVEAVPPAQVWLSQLRAAHLVASMQNAATSTTVASALEAAGVQALVYKGTALAAQTTGDWKGRSSQDVDVLVAPQQVTAAHEILVGLNFARRDGKPGPPSWPLRYYECERTYDGALTTVDLHWRIDAAPGFLGLSFGELWSARQRVSAEGLRVWTPGPVDVVLITAVHGTRERWARLRWALDAAAQLGQLEVGHWSALAERSRRGAAKSLHLMLAVVEECGVTGLPWQASTRARLTAESFLRHAVEVGYGRADLAATTSSSAWERRRGRADVAPRVGVQLDDLSRAAVRQVLGSAELSLLPFRSRGTR